jgi:hypothetical protein
LAQESNTIERVDVVPWSIANMCVLAGMAGFSYRSKEALLF